MYTAVLQVVIYQLAKFEKDTIKMAEKSQNADSGKEIKVHQSNSWSKRQGTMIEQVLAYCRHGQKYVVCIELFVCLTVTMTFSVRA